MMDLSDLYYEIKWPPDRTFQLIGLGLNAVDWICLLPSFPEQGSKLPIQSLHKLGGGQVATACALCARYGLKVRYIGRVGDDENGAFAKDNLGAEPMELCVETISGASSQYAIILVDQPTGERTILWNRDPRLTYGAGELRQEWVTAGQLLHLDGHDQGAAIQAAQWARGAGMKVCLDIDKVQPGVEELVRLTDFLLPTRNFVTRLTGISDWRKALIETSGLTEGFIAVTLGEGGCAAVCDGDIFEVAGFSVPAVDTTGAGDVFHGAFIFALFQEWDADACLRFANAAAGLSCQKLGSRSSIPGLDAVIDLLF